MYVKHHVTTPSPLQKPVVVAEEPTPATEETAPTTEGESSTPTVATTPEAEEVKEKVRERGR